MTSYRYEVTDANEVKIWDESSSDPSGAPNFYQPRYPGGADWLDKDDAIAWAESFIANMLDPYGAPIPKSYPDEEPQYATPPVEE